MIRICWIRRHYRICRITRCINTFGSRLHSVIHHLHECAANTGNLPRIGYILLIHFCISRLFLADRCPGRFHPLHRILQNRLHDCILLGGVLRCCVDFRLSLDLVHHIHFLIGDGILDRNAAGRRRQFIVRILIICKRFDLYTIISGSYTGLVNNTVLIVILHLERLFTGNLYFKRHAADQLAGGLIYKFDF